MNRARTLSLIAVATARSLAAMASIVSATRGPDALTRDGQGCVSRDLDARGDALLAPRSGAELTEYATLARIRAAMTTELTRRARRGLAMYLGATFAISLAIQASIYLAGGPITDHTWSVVALMWTPGLVSLAVRAVRREGLADISLRLGKNKRAYLVAWLFPLVVGGAAYGAAWLSGLETFEAPSTSGLGLTEVAAGPRFAITIVIALVIGPPLAGLTAAGEELGWRGYMLTRLIDARVPAPILTSGLIWGLWHVPLIVTGQYAAGPYPLLSACTFLVCISAGAVVAAHVRLASGSVWPAVIFHASWNALIQGPFDGFTRGGDAAQTTSIWVGESGLLVVGASVLAATLVWHVGRASREMLHDPQARPGRVAESTAVEPT